MKYLATITLLFIAISASANDQSGYDRVINQFSQSCRGLANQALQSYVFSAKLFNEGQLHLADRYFEQGKELSRQLMISDQCNLEDIKIMMAQNESMQNVHRNTLCLIRHGEAKRAAEAAQAAGNLYEWDEAINHATTAIWTLRDMVNSRICRDMPEGFDQYLSNLVDTHAGLVETLEAAKAESEKTR